jgi:hypothetical protein
MLTCSRVTLVPHFFNNLAVPLERVDLEMTAYLNWQRGVKFVLRPKPVAG